MTGAGVRASEVLCGHVEELMRWDPTPLGARAAMALSRVVGPLDVRLGVQLCDLACDLAHRVGEGAGLHCAAKEIPDIPVLLRDDPELVDAFATGVDRGAHYAGFLACRPATDAAPGGSVTGPRTLIA